MAFLDDVLSDITPSERDAAKERELAKEILSIIRGISKRINPEAIPIMVGSVAKGTDLRGDKDFDVFVQFPTTIPRKDLEDQGLAIGRRFFELSKTEPEISYAEHPYVKGKYNGFTLEIVPCYKMDNGRRIMSAVDRSPLHTQFVISELSKRPALRGEIRLLKKFMKAHGLYGAHAAVEGFSGYLCELLVIKYGSFTGVVKAASGWKNREYITLSKGAKRSIKEMKDAPLVFIDPVDPNRNVAAAVSVEKLAGMIRASETFLRKPSREAFYSKAPLPLSKNEFYKKMQARGTELIAVVFKVPKLVEDTLIPQLSKSLRALAYECERAGFRILKKGQWTDGKEAVFVIEFEVWALPRVMRKTGPFFDSKVADIDGFIKSNKAKAISPPYLDGDKWVIDVEREHRHADEFIKNFLKHTESFGKNLRGIKNFDILVNTKIQKIASKDFWKFMRTLF